MWRKVYKFISQISIFRVSATVEVWFEHIPEHFFREDLLLFHTQMNDHECARTTPPWWQALENGDVSLSLSIEYELFSPSMIRHIYELIILNFNKQSHSLRHKKQKLLFSKCKKPEDKTG